MVTNFGIRTLGSRPALGYSARQLDRAVGIRSDNAALKRCCEHAQAGTYVIGGELVVLKANNELCEPLFSQIEARALGVVREVAFLGLADAAPPFGFGLDQDAVEQLNARNDLNVT